MPVQPSVPKPEQEPVDIFAVVDRSPERPPEVKPEKVREALEQHGSRFEQHPEVSAQPKELPSAAPTPTADLPLPISGPDQQLQHVELVLAEGLQDIFASLPPAEQQKFKAAGEQAAQEVYTLLGQARVKVSAIVDVIRRWLSSIPGVNKFFVEQEAKIKAETCDSFAPTLDVAHLHYSFWHYWFTRHWRGRNVVVTSARPEYSAGAACLPAGHAT